MTDTTINIDLTKTHPESRILAGAIAGASAAIAMGVVAMVVSFSLGMGFWFPLELISGAFVGVKAVLGGPEMALLGLITHLFTGALLGVIFAVIVSPLETGRQAFWEGMIYGVLVWAVMSYVILPLVNHTMSERLTVVAGWWFICHLIFGGMLYITPELHRNFEARFHREEIPVTPIQIQ